MKVLVIGAHGQIGKHVVPLMAKKGYPVRAMVRHSEQVDALKELGAEAVVADLEQEIAPAFSDCQAVVFTAGSGAHTGPDKTIAVDQEGALKAIRAAEEQGINRFLMVSSMRAEEPEKGPEQIRHYLRAKKAADDRLQSSTLNYTIIRPGRLTNDPGKGTVSIAEHLEVKMGEIPRMDVASVLVEALEAETTYHRTLELLTGDTPIHEALHGR